MSENSVAFVFPGQGSQSVGMLSELAADFPSVKETFAEASD
ncbi:MAG: malonyl CoA-acyl carrier protein transacylase, partial [Pseudomonadota bacterium]